MKYQEAMQKIDTEKALSYLGLEVKKDGAYVNFPCECGANATARAYGEKKNVWYCPNCKKGGQIISLAVKAKGIDFQEAKKLLIEKTALPDKPIEDELNLNYTLEWCSLMDKLALNQELCQKLGVGKPKGKTMLSGMIVFTVYNEHGVKVAYYGIDNNLNPKFHSSFNPELYLWNYHNLDRQEEVWITTDMFDCLRLIQSGKQACCNFGLPYLSTKQYYLLSDCDRVVLNWKGDKRDIAFSNISQLKTFYRFA